METITAGSRAIDFTLTALDGKRYSLSEAIKEGPVLAAFYKASCPVCQFTFPFIERFHRHFRDSKAHVWAISQDPEAEAAEFAEEYGLTMPILLEDLDTYATSNAYGLSRVPTVFLIGQNGEVLHSFAGFSRQDFLQVARKLETLTGRKGFVPFREEDDVPEYKPG